MKGGTKHCSSIEDEDELGSGIFPKWLKILLSYVLVAFPCKALLFSADTVQRPEGIEMTSRAIGFSSVVPRLCLFPGRGCLVRI